MLSKLLFIVFIMSFIAFAQNQTDSVAQTVAETPIELVNSDDLGVVRSILDQCGLNNLAVEDVATVESGRVVSLDLTNSDVAKDGISEIPADIGKLTALKKFVCNFNIVTTIPDEIGNLTELQELILQSNRISALPGAIGGCSNIIDLDLRHNQLESIPNEIGNLKQLTRLWLWGNKLTLLNDTITTIKSLKEIYLKDNRLTTLPDGIIKMNIDYIDIIGNSICKPSTAINAWLTKRNKRFIETQKCW